MQVREVMRRDAATVQAHQRLSTAAGLMRERNCGFLPVVDQGFRVVGVLTDRDISMAALRSDQPLSALQVRDAMSAKAFCCRPTDSLDDAERWMARHQVRRLPVIDARDRLVGVLSLDDVAREACDEAELLQPQVSADEVGRTLGQIARPHLVLEASAAREHREHAPQQRASRRAWIRAPG